MLNEVVDNTLGLFGQQFTAADISIEKNLSDTSPVVIANQTQLEQVLLNLFINSRDAFEEQEVASNLLPVVRIETEENDGSVILRVADNAGGIPEKALDRVFEPFFTTKDVGRGTGLGLSISYGIIKEMGGEIHARNTNGGALFTVTLPAVDQKPDQA